MPSADGDRRQPSEPVAVAGDGGLPVEVVLPLGDEPVVVAGVVVSVTGSTVVVALPSGVAALAVAASSHAVLVWEAGGDERCAVVRAGRRSGDVHSPTTVELVVDDGRAVAALAAVAAAALPSPSAG